MGQQRARVRARAVARAAAHAEPRHYARVPRKRLLEVFRSEALLAAFHALETDLTRPTHGAPPTAPFYRVRRQEIPPDIAITPIAM